MVKSPGFPFGRWLPCGEGASTYGLGEGFGPHSEAFLRGIPVAPHP